MTYKERHERALAIVGGITIMAATIAGVHVATKVDSQPSIYSLIVSDYAGTEWVVDYNLTRSDCESMRVSIAARCSRQPEGKLP